MQLKPICLALLLACGSATPGLVAAANQTAASKAAAVQTASVEGITEYRLANGLRVLLAPDASKPTTTVNVTYLVGSRHENYGETGMAHLLEHLVFKGTKTSGNLMDELSKRGMQFNGTTFFDRTNYYETFPANEEHLKWALSMEADRMVNSKIAKSDLDTEFSVVRNEMESGENNPFQSLWKQLSAVTFDWHNYGKSTIGARADVEGVKIENLQAFYRMYYQPDNAVLTVAGKFDPVATLALIEKTFGALKAPNRVLPQTWTREAPRDGTREITVRRVGDVQLAAVLYPTSAGSHADSAALSVLGEVLTNTPNGRLHKNLVESKKAVGSMGINFELAEPGYAMFLTQLSKDQNLPEAKKLLIETVEGFAQKPVSEEELKQAKTQILNGVEKTINDPQRLCVELSEYIALGDWRMFFLQRDRVEAVTVADVQRVAANYLRADNRSVGQYVPVEKAERTVIPESPNVADLVKDYKGRAAVAAGEAFDASPANIDQRTQSFKLDSGAQVAFLAKKTRGETVNGRITLRMGNADSLFGKAYLSDLATDMLLRGAGGSSRAELSARLAELKTNLGISGSGQNVNIMFDTTRENLPAVLTLLKDVLRAPDFPQSEFDLLVKENMAALESQRSTPEFAVQQAQSKARNVLYKKGDIRYADSYEDSLAGYQSAKLADVKAFYKAFFGASHAQVSLVGDFDASAAQTQLATLLGDWRSGQAYQRAPSLLQTAKGGVEKLETPDKANAFYSATLPFAMKDTDADYPAMLMVNKVLGGGIKSRLFERLRQKDGLSYGAGSGFNASPLDNVGGLMLYAIYAPQNREKIETAVREELARLVKDGLTQQELADAKLAFAQERNVGRAQDGALVGALANNLFLGRSFAFDADIDAKVNQLSLETVNAVLRKVVQPDAVAHYFGGDFAGAAKKAPAGAN